MTKEQILTAGTILSGDNAEEQLQKLLEFSGDREEIIDYIDGVNVIQSLQFSLTVNEFFDMLPDDNKMDKPFNQDFFNDIAVEFDTHVKQSIPLFGQFQSYVSSFIADKFQGKSILDICGSTGELGRQLIFGGWRGHYDCLDGSPEMRDVFNSVTPQNVREHLNFIMAGFSGGWKEEYKGEEIHIPEYIGVNNNHSLAVEVLGFQFFTKERLEHIKEMKRLAGNCLFFQKFSTQDDSQWQENEDLKNTLHKSLFFSEQEIKEKKEVVLDNMRDYLYNQNDFTSHLESEFKYVIKLAQIGNFAGYYCTNDVSTLPDYVNPYLLDNQFTSTETKKRK